MAETTMQQKEQLQLMSADELWSLREDVDSKLAARLLERKNILEARLDQLPPHSKEHLQKAR
jgi:hypothetical protein